MSHLYDTFQDGLCIEPEHLAAGQPCATPTPIQLMARMSIQLVELETLEMLAKNLADKGEDTAHAMTRRMIRMSHTDLAKAARVLLHIGPTSKSRS